MAQPAMELAGRRRADRPPTDRLRQNEPRGHGQLTRGDVGMRTAPGPIPGHL